MTTWLVNQLLVVVKSLSPQSDLLRLQPSSFENPAGPFAHSGIQSCYTAYQRGGFTWLVFTPILRTGQIPHFQVLPLTREQCRSFSALVTVLSRCSISQQATVHGRYQPYAGLSSPPAALLPHFTDGETEAEVKQLAQGHRGKSGRGKNRSQSLLHANLLPQPSENSFPPYLSCAAVQSSIFRIEGKKM